MKKFLSSTAVAVALCLCSSVFADQQKTTTKEEFNEWCDAWKGRWVGEVTFVADWPGLGKRGEKVTAYLDATPLKTGKVWCGSSLAVLVLAPFYSPMTRSRSKSNQCQSYPADSPGRQSFTDRTAHGCKKAKEAYQTAKGVREVTIYTFSESGRKVVTTGSGSVDGKPNEKLADVWRRVSE